MLNEIVQIKLFESKDLTWTFFWNMFAMKMKTWPEKVVFKHRKMKQNDSIARDDEWDAGRSKRQSNLRRITFRFVGILRNAIGVAPVPPSVLPIIRQARVISRPWCSNREYAFLVYSLVWIILFTYYKEYARTLLFIYLLRAPIIYTTLLARVLCIATKYA